MDTGREVLVTSLGYVCSCRQERDAQFQRVPSDRLDKLANSSPSNFLVQNRRLHIAQTAVLLSMMLSWTERLPERRT